MSRLHRLVQAARHEDVKVELLQGADVNAISANLTPLNEAISNNDVAMVDILIRAGADVNHGHPISGKRPLVDAVTKDLRILELLLNAGADVEGCRVTNTPLCIAAAFGKREAYDRLIAAGANPDATINGKPASEAIDEASKAHEWMMTRMEETGPLSKPDLYADQVKKLMGEYPTVEEYAAHRGRCIYIYSFDQGIFTDSEVGNWARRLGEIIRSSELLEQLEEELLSGQELETVRRERRRTERHLARTKAKQERIAKAAELDSTITS